MSTYRISIALCTYNGQDYLADQLASIAGQARLPDELIVVDDGSDDNTVFIVDAFAKKAPFKTKVFVNETNLGSSKNFGRAIGLCSGDIIALADQDDVWRIDKLQRIEELFIASPEIGAVFTNGEVVGPDLQPFGVSIWEAAHFRRSLQLLVQNGRAIDVLMMFNVVTGATLAFRRTFVDLVLPIPGVWVHDGWIAFVIAAAAKIACIDESLVLYRQHGNNQVGAASTVLARRIASSWRAPPKQYLVTLGKMIEQYEALRERLSAKLNDLSGDSLLINRLNQKILHLQRRRDVLEARRRMLFRLITELVAGRYHRYSLGWRGFANDLIYVLRTGIE